MEKITNITQLRIAIRLLEIKQAKEEQVLKEQFKITYENLKPINLIRNTLSQLAHAPDLKGDLLNATMGIATGYLSKKIVVGTSHNRFKQILGTLLQMGVTSLVSKNADGIKSGIMSVLNNVFSKKEKESETK